MRKSFYSIENVCDAKAGITALIFSDMTNVSGYGPGNLPPTPGNPPGYIDNSKVYSIGFERHTGILTKESRTNDGGSYNENLVSAFVPRSRSDVEELLKRQKNRFLSIVAIDRYGNQHVLYNALRDFRHTTGDKPGTRHGYSISFSAPDHFLLPSLAGNGDIDTAPPPPGGGGGGGDDDSGCCVTINPIQIAYTPLPTANANNRNQLVTTTNGTLYFIDGDGRGVLVNRPGPIYYEVQVAEGATDNFVTLPAWFPLPDPADYAAPTYDPVAEINRRMFVFLGSRGIAYEDIEGWYIDFGTNRAYFYTSIDGALLRFWVQEGIPPNPL